MYRNVFHGQIFPSDSLQTTCVSLCTYPTPLQYLMNPSNMIDNVLECQICVRKRCTG